MADRAAATVLLVSFSFIPWRKSAGVSVLSRRSCVLVVLVVLVVYHASIASNPLNAKAKGGDIFRRNTGI